MCGNTLGAFSGFGRHTVNDFLFQEAIFPGTPSYLLCQDDEVFERFVESLEGYLKSFDHDSFYKRTVSITNSTNPFAFNEKSNDQYMKHHILIFRRTTAKVDRELYERYCRAGLLDSDHTIGTLYLYIYMLPISY